MFQFQKDKTIFLKIALISLSLLGALLVFAKFESIEKKQKTVSSDFPKEVVQLSSHSVGQNEEAQSVLRLSFFGDLMLDRSVRKNIEKRGLEVMFQNSGLNFSSSDKNIANLEGVLADYTSVSVGTAPEEPAHFKFVFDLNSIEFFKDRGFEIMNLGNNHIGNFGAKGIVATKDNLEKNNISFFGQPDDAENNFLISEENGVKFALVGYNEFKKESDEDAIRQIAQVKKVADIVIVYAHWGKEYEDLPDAKQITLAHRFIDAGADVIIGSHPHVIQSIENYKNKYIFYSLGNFIFDQFFSPETQKGLNVQMHYDKKEKKFAYSLIPFQMKINFQWKIFSGEELNQELNRIADMSMVTETEKAKIRTGVL